MKYLDLTLPTAAENLACDEALLEWGEQDESVEALRFWTPPSTFVVAGYANQAAREVDLEACAVRGIPVFRRVSGGGTVLQGPGCLNYALVLQVAQAVELQSIVAANAYVLERHRRAMENLLGRPVRVQGQTDLAIDGRKFSGNAQRRRRRAALFHGTFLLGLDVELVEAVLRQPSREPAYRAGRLHREFVVNLKLPAEAVKEALRRAWGADEPLAAVPLETVNGLVRDKYTQAAWNLRL